MFGFQKIKRERFNSTFLRKVELKFSFDEIKDLKNKYTEISDLFSSIFPRIKSGKNRGFQISIGGEEKLSDFKQINENDSVSLKSEDGQIELLVNSEHITLSIEGKKYSSFEDNILPILDKMTQLLKLLSVELISDLGLRKLNLIEFEYSQPVKPNDILFELLNESIIYSLNAYPAMECISQSIQNIQFKDGHYTLNSTYGVSSLTVPEKKIGQLIVDNNILLDSTIKTNRLTEEMGIINTELFNVFSWIFNEKSKIILKNEN